MNGVPGSAERCVLPLGLVCCPSLLGASPPLRAPIYPNSNFKAPPNQQRPSRPVGLGVPALPRSPWMREAARLNCRVIESSSSLICY